MPRRCTYPGCYNECIQNRKKGRLRRNAVSPKVKIQRFTYQYHDIGFGVSIQTAVPNIEPYFRKKICTLFCISIGISSFWLETMVIMEGEIKSGTNDGVVCILNFYDYHGVHPKRGYVYTNANSVLMTDLLQKSRFLFIKWFMNLSEHIHENFITHLWKSSN